MPFTNGIRVIPPNRHGGQKDLHTLVRHFRRGRTPVPKGAAPWEAEDVLIGLSPLQEVSWSPAAGVGWRPSHGSVQSFRPPMAITGDALLELPVAERRRI